MKSIIICLLGCTWVSTMGGPATGIVTGAVLQALAQAQHQYQAAVANSPQYARKVAQKHGIFPRLAAQDTLFIVERVAETGAPLLMSYLWTSRRDCVVRYQSWPVFKSTVLPYKSFDDPLRPLTEQMDTAKILRGTSFLDAPKVFISQVQRERFISTYYFSDVTPLLYEYK